MSISMIGIDYKKASVDVRAQFSFTKKNAAAALENLKKEPGILGCIILSTCNRMEIWASTGEDWKGSLYEFLCREKEKDPREFEKYFVKRGRRGGCGTFILSHQRPEISDPCGGPDHYPGKGCPGPFQRGLLYGQRTGSAVPHGCHRGKKSKDPVSFSRANSSVIHQAIERLEDQGFSLQGKTCNGHRERRNGKGYGSGPERGRSRCNGYCASVQKRDRYHTSGLRQDQLWERDWSFLPKCDLVVSATASPNYTLTMEQIENARIPGHVVLIDLAVPRDIEPSAGTLNNVTLYDIDSFKIDAVSPKLQASLDQGRRNPAGTAGGVL